MSKILAFSGSNHSKSINQTLVRYASSFVQKSEVELIDLNDYSSPMFSLDIEANEGYPSSIQKLEQQIRSYDALLIALPEHNGSMTSFFKNTLDWLSRINREFLKDKKVLLLSTSPGKYGAKFGLEHTASILPRFGAKIIGQYNLGSFYEKVILSEGFLLSDKEKDVELKNLVLKLDNSL